MEQNETVVTNPTEPTAGGDLVYEEKLVGPSLEASLTADSSRQLGYQRPDCPKIVRIEAMTK